jgi:hypothetical protein
MGRGLRVVICFLVMFAVACDDSAPKDSHRPSRETSAKPSTTTTSGGMPQPPGPDGGQDRDSGARAPGSSDPSPAERSGLDLRTVLLQLEDLPAGFQLGRARSYDSVPQAFLCPNLRPSLPAPKQREGAIFSSSEAVPSIVEEVVADFDSQATALRFTRSIRDAVSACPRFTQGPGGSASTEVRLQPLPSPNGQRVAASFRATATGPNAGSVDVVLVTEGRYAAVLLDAGPAKLPSGTFFVLAGRARNRLAARANS